MSNDFGTAYDYDKKEANGKTFTLSSGFKVNLAFMHTAEMEAIVNKAATEKKEELERDLTLIEHEESGREVFKKHILVGWADDATMNGKPFPFTDENKEIAIGYPVFLNECLTIAQNNQSFKTKVIEEDVKK